MSANAVGSPSMVKVAIAPATWDTLDGALFDEGSGITELDKMLKHIGEGNLTISTHMTDESESPDAPSALLTVTKNGVEPFVVGIWGGVDVIRGPYSDAASGGLRLTGLITAEVDLLGQAPIDTMKGPA